MIPLEATIAKRPRDQDSATVLQETIRIQHPKNTNIEETTYLIADIHAALTTKQRLIVLRKVYTLLAGDDSIVFKYLQAGILNALTIQLHHLIHRQHGSTISEVDLLCNCLSIFFERCRKDLQGYIEEKGVDFLVLLTEVVLFSLHRRHTKQLQSNGSPLILSSISCVLMIWNVISTLCSGAQLLVESKTVIPTIVTLLYDIELPEESIQDALSLLKNVTYFHEDSHKKLLQHQRFLPGLARLSSRHALSLKTKQRLSAVLRNLATSPDCRIILVRQPRIIGCLVKLMAVQPRTHLEATTPNENMMPDSESLYKNVLNCLLSLSMDNEAALIFIFHGDGVILEILKRYLSYSEASIRKKAASIMRLLVNEATMPLLIHDANLLQMLSQTALKDSSPAVRHEAAEAFAKCAALAQAEQQPHFEAVLDALTLLASIPKLKSQTKTAVSHDVLALTLCEQSRHQCNRVAMVDRQALLETIADLALLRTELPSHVAQDACCALMYLSMEEANRERMATNPKILDALLSNLTAYQPAIPNASHSVGTDGQYDAKECAIQTIGNLAHAVPTRSVMARHTCLIQTLIQVARTLDDDALKATLKIAILLLASEF